MKELCFFVVIVASFLLGAAMTWNFACYRIQLNIESGTLTKGGITKN
jgi:hypothetical protein